MLMVLMLIAIILEYSLQLLKMIESHCSSSHFAPAFATPMYTKALESELPCLGNIFDEAMISSNSSYNSLIILALCNIVYAL